MLRPHEVLLNGLIEELEKRVVIVIDIENDNGIDMESQLFPGNHLLQLLQGATSPR